MESLPTAAFLGASYIGQSLITGLLGSGVAKNKIILSDHNPNNLEYVGKHLGIKTDSSHATVAALAPLLILAAPAADTKAIAHEISGTLKTHHPLIISIAGGVHTAHLERWLGSHTAIVRAIPNIAALLQASATGLYANLQVTELQKNLAESLLRTVGITVWIDHESDMDAVTALSEAGPAYFFVMMEALQQSAEALGLRPAIAELLTLQTALGAARVALESEADLHELRRRIVSTGSATETALNILEQGGLHTLFKKALGSAKERAVEMSHLFD